MKTTILMFAMFMAACAVDLSTPTGGVGSVEQSKPPAPQPDFQFCGGIYTCDALNPFFSDDACTSVCGEQAYCPGYTSVEISTCIQHPFASGCCEDDSGASVPCFRKKCIKGQRP
ncbi:MAG: hypothetical protein ABR520_11400 [Mycobacteriales bacterium]|nr:hypothetical protein [Actinomycetota bacterium]